jgi:hypothetical protein
MCDFVVGKASVIFKSKYCIDLNFNYGCLDLEMFVKLKLNLLGIWPHNKQNGLKTQFFLE